MVLKELRKIYKISMQELADEILVSKQLIGQIEKGNRSITDNVLCKLVEYFGLTKEITDDYRNFLLKDSMDDAEVLKVKKVKLEKDINNMLDSKIFYEKEDYQITKILTKEKAIEELEKIYNCKIKIVDKIEFINI